ncbi:MAG: TolC family protein, partial [Deltaproteobacteria bacterium]|nr:TolC family protein [Deltaproteobacteria bacterium]
MKRICFTCCGVLLFLLIASIGWSAESQKSPPLLNLEELILRTLQVHPELKALEKEAEAVQDRSQAARSWEDPEVGVRFYQVPFGKGLDAAGDIDYILSQKIPFPGKRKTDSEIIYHEYLHHLESLNARGRSLLKEIKTTYYELYSIQKQIASNR